MANKQNKKSIVFGASGGIGAAIVNALVNARGSAAVIPVCRSDGDFDLKNEASIAALADKFSGETFDFLFNATGVLSVDDRGPEKAFSMLNEDTMAEGMAVNAIGPALIMKHFLPLVAPSGRAVVAHLSARVGSIGDNRLGGWMSYRASKAALNQIVRCAAIETSRRNKDAIVAAIHPGTIETDLTRRFAKGRYTATPDEAAQRILGVLNALTPEDTGGFFDYAGAPVPW